MPRDKVVSFFKNVDKEHGRVVLPHDLVVLGSSVARYVAST